MGVPLLQIDAFSAEPFAGNPAAVCLLETPARAVWMQQVAAEMNLSETAFVVPRGEDFDLRWFTPTLEVDLCGHATLASAHALWEMGRLERSSDARFHTRSGLLTATSADPGSCSTFPRGQRGRQRRRASCSPHWAVCPCSSVVGATIM